MSDAGATLNLSDRTALEIREEFAGRRRGMGSARCSPARR